MGTASKSLTVPAADELIVAMYQQVLSAESIQRHDRTGGWFKRYCAGIAQGTGPQRYLRAIRNSLKLDERPVKGLRVLELGSGFGLTATTLAMMGAAEVHCVDTNAQMLETMSAYLAELPMALPIQQTQGVASRLPMPDGHFDLVFSVEALSHFLNPELCMAEAHRVLKPGGRLVVADDNNALNDRAVRETREVWDRFENGPVTADIHGHRVLEPYVQRRARIIREAFPALAEHEVERLAQRTCYRVKSEILEDVRNFIASGQWPNHLHAPERCPVEPESGQFIENLIDPLALRQQLQGLGFEARAEAYFGGESRGGLLYAANTALNRCVPDAWLFKKSDGFRIRALKVA